MKGGCYCEQPDWFYEEANFLGKISVEGSGTFVLFCVNFIFPLFIYSKVVEFQSQTLHLGK